MASQWGTNYEILGYQLILSNLHSESAFDLTWCKIEGLEILEIWQTDKLSKRIPLLQNLNLSNSKPNW
jgi:hypothetical protein